MHSRDDVRAWTAYLREAEEDYELAANLQDTLWLMDGKVSEGFIEAVERTAQAQLRCVARHIAFEAFMAAA